MSDYRRHDASYLAGTLPGLNDTSGNPLSLKFSARDIEATFGRKIEGSSAGSVLEKMTTDGEIVSTALAVAPAGVNGAVIESNLRFTDTATTGTGVDGNKYIYYLGHPSEAVNSAFGLVDNHATKVEVQTIADLTYTMNIVLLTSPGGGQTTGLTTSDVQRLVTEASSIWEQIGVRFALGTTTTVAATNATQWDLPDDNVSTLTAVTTTSRANGLDVFIVNSINSTDGFLSGAAAYENRLWVGDRETGVVVSRRKMGPTSTLEDISEIARTIAHEVGHLIFNNADHDPRLWNLMRAGGAGSSNNSDLTLTVRGSSGERIRLYPDEYNVDETW